MAKPSVAYGSLPFQEQSAFFRRKLNLPTQAWTDILHEAHDHAFVVAGANRDDLVLAFREAVDKAVNQGGTLETFRKDFDAIVERFGWSYNGGRNWRSRVIYETNLRSSYAAGRYAQLQAVKKLRPFWRYRHSDSVQHPRPMHLAWNGLVLHADDLWWKTHYPPNGWGCECTVESLSQRDMDRLGKAGPDTAPAVDMQTVTIGINGPTPRTMEVPAGIDPGFGYIPGADSWTRQQAQRDLANAVAGERDTWEPMIKTTAKDLGRPAVLQEPMPVDPMPRAATVEDAVTAIEKAFNSPSAVIDVKGMPAVIDAKVLGEHMDLNRSEYIPLLPDVLAHPFEVWSQVERNARTGALRMRVRVIKAYQVGAGRTVLVVLDKQGSTLVGWTVIPVRAGNYIENQRQGALWYGSQE